MSLRVVIPRLGWHQQAVLKNWLVDEGDWISADAPICLLQVGQQTHLVKAHHSGFWQPLVNPAAVRGVTISCHTVIGNIVAPGETPGRAQDNRDELPGRVPRRVDQALARRLLERLGPPRHGRVSPRARKLAAEYQVDVSQLTGSGRQGRIVERDVRRLAELRATRRRPQVAAVMADTISARNLATLHSTLDVGPWLPARRAAGGPLSAEDRQTLLDHLLLQLAQLPALQASAAASGSPNTSASRLLLHVVEPAGQRTSILPLPMLVAAGRGAEGLTQIRAIRSQARTAADNELRATDIHVFDASAAAIDSLAVPPPDPAAWSLSVPAVRWLPLPEEGKLRLRPVVQLTLIVDLSKRTLSEATALVQGLATVVTTRT